MSGAAGKLEIPGRCLRLSRRHAELVWLLADAPNGLTAQELNAELHDHGQHLITIRAEINRLRRVLGGQMLESRPYRLTMPLITDTEEVSGLLASGRLSEALARFTGAPLADSEAPGIRRRSAEFVASLRQAVIDSRSAPALERWTSLAEGHDDLLSWQVLESELPMGSSRRAIARAHVARLRA